MARKTKTLSLTFLEFVLQEKSCLAFNTLIAQGIMETSTSSTKRLILECAHGVKGAIDTLEADTLTHVREKIHEELDDDMIPNPDFSLHVDDIRIALKQEKKNRAWDLLSQNIRLQVKIPPISSLDGFNNGTTSLNQIILENTGSEPLSAKRIRTETSGPEYNSLGNKSNSGEHKELLNDGSNGTTSRDSAFSSAVKNTAKKNTNRNSSMAKKRRVHGKNAPKKSMLGLGPIHSGTRTRRVCIKEGYQTCVKPKRKECHDHSKETALMNKNTQEYCVLTTSKADQMQRSHSALKKKRVCLREGCEKVLENLRCRTKFCPNHRGLCRWKDCSTFRTGCCDGYCTRHYKMRSFIDL